MQWKQVRRTALSQSTLASTNKKFRVLTIDGGGTRGVLSARILSNIETTLNRRYNQEVPIGKRFDFIVGTSTGGIIALALAMGRRADEVVRFYEEHIPNIFGKRHKARFPYWLGSPFYKPESLRVALTEFFKDATLRDMSTDVCVTAVSLQNAAPRFYKSEYLTRNAARSDEKLVEIALATSAAPVYFPAHSMHRSASLIDGGICANNPSLVALVDALQFQVASKRGTPPPPDGSKRLLSDIVLLSIGTGMPAGMPYNIDKLRNGGTSAWIFGLDRSNPSFPFASPIVPLIEILMQSQSQLADFQTGFLLGPQNYLRINPQLKFSMSLDNVDKITELKNLCDVTVSIEKFLVEQLVP